MKLDGQTFKRIQRIITELSNIDLPEDELKEIAVAGIEAHRHRKKGVTFTYAQMQYRLRKNKSTTPDLADKVFNLIPLQDSVSSSKSKEILSKTKIWFEEVPCKLKNKLKR
jgi:CRISPR/Cas system-associated endonuclease Cas3-HD